MLLRRQFLHIFLAAQVEVLEGVGAGRELHIVKAVDGLTRSGVERDVVSAGLDALALIVAARVGGEGVEGGLPVRAEYDLAVGYRGVGRVLRMPVDLGRGVLATRKGRNEDKQDDSEP